MVGNKHRCVIYLRIFFHVWGKKKAQFKTALVKSLRLIIKTFYHLMHFPLQAELQLVLLQHLLVLLQRLLVWHRHRQ